MKIIELALNVCTVLGVLLVTFAVMLGALVGHDIVESKRRK